MTPVATSRGVTSFCTGSVPSARIASICSVTFIEPSSLAIPDALRPATMTAVSTGPNSRTRMMETNGRSGPSARSLEAAAHLHRHHGAGEKAGEHHDGHAADTDSVHLQHNVVEIVRFSEDVPESPAGEFIELLYRKDGALEDVEHGF